MAKPDKINHWVTLVISVVLILGVGFKIQYDVDENTTRSEENEKAVDSLDVIENEIKHFKDEQRKQGEKIDKILERLRD